MEAYGKINHDVELNHEVRVCGDSPPCLCKEEIITVFFLGNLQTLIPADSPITR